jgi:hypothetical protein
VFSAAQAIWGGVKSDEKSAKKSEEIKEGFARDYP